MVNKDTLILNEFINSPDLRIHSENYPFINFDFGKRNVNQTTFRFPHNSILGIQAEACFKEYLSYSKSFELLASNLQISGRKETLGELDFIVQNKNTEEVIHIELACKFYLYDLDAGSTIEERWIGPNRKDTLFDKLEKVKRNQFPILYSKEATEKLASLNIQIPSSQELCLKAFLFIPKNMSKDDFPNNYRDCVVGNWIENTDFIKLEEDVVYAIPNKKEWLFPPNLITEWLSFSEINVEIEKRFQFHKSPLIYKKTKNKLERFFVVCW